MWFQKTKSVKDREAALDEEFARRKEAMQRAKKRLDDALKGLDGVTQDVAEAFK
jgi:hypothetical protein